MILDVLANLSKYTINTRLALAELQKYVLTQKHDLFQKGKFEIDGDNFFGIGIEYETKAEKECLWESHREYVDIHYILEGEEIVSISDIAEMTNTTAYDSTNDYQLFEGIKQQDIVLKKDYVLVLFPNECHQTGVQYKEVSLVKKIVFKLALC